MSSCHGCGTELPEGIEVFRTSSCAVCGKDLNVCLNCEFYAPGSHWDCRESISELVREKDRANFCDFFRLARQPRGPGERGPAKRDRARGDLGKLFGDE